MQITPLAADSLGTRSVSTLVVANGLRILIDPGVSLGPNRYSLPPHEKEINAFKTQWKNVVHEAERSDIIIVTHYHYDHYNPFENLDIYKDKTVFLKHPTNNINQSQKDRAKEFLELLNGAPRTIEYADGKEFKTKGVTINFSKAVTHGGKDTKLGFVVMTSINDGKNCFVHASDSQGPSVKETTDWIIEQNPDTVFLDGLATIFLGWMEDPKLLDLANAEEIRLLENSNLNTIILDHHLVRDLYYYNKIKPVIDKAQLLKKRLVTSAEYLGQKNSFLEARRKELWKETPEKTVKELPRFME